MKTGAVEQVTPKSVGIWIRVSTEDQAHGESPAHHEQRARFYAQAKGWTVKEVYDLAGVSGKSVMEHPEAKRMLADIHKGHITGLIFSKLARLARNTKDLLDFSEIFHQCNADLISLQESIDTSTPAGRLFYTMIAAMAQWEREEITDRVRASIGIRAKLGKPLNASAPFGYQWKDKKLVIDPPEAAIRKRAYELYLEHRRKGVVARILNEAGDRTSRNKKWSDTAIQRILTCPSAKGFYRLAAFKYTGDWKREEKAADQWGVVEVEPIITEELWRKVNEILQEQHRPQKRPAKRPVHLFAGLAVCACGGKMYVPSNMPKYVCSKCRNKIPIIDLEGIFYDELKAYFVAPERIAKLLQEATNNTTEKESVLVEHQKKIQKVQEDIRRTHELYLQGQIAVERFGEFNKPFEEQLQQLQGEAAKLQADVDFAKVKDLSAEEIVQEAENLYSRWPQLAVEDKRKIVESITEKIVIGKEGIDITLAYMPSSEELANSQRGLTVMPTS